MTEKPAKKTRGMKEIRPGVWRLKVYAGRHANGSPIQLTKTVDSGQHKLGAGVRLAERELAKMRTKAAGGTGATGNETFGWLVEEWLDQSEPRLSPTTMREYRRIADKVVIPDLGGIKLSKLGSKDLDRLYRKLEAKDNAATTIRRVHALIGAALHQGEDWDLVDRNVAKRARPPQIRQAQMEAPSPAEVQRILVAAEKSDPTMAVMLLMAALTGARRGELCGFRWSDLDSKARTLTIPRSIYEKPGQQWGEKPTKTHQARTIGLDDLGIEALKRHRTAVDALAKKLGLKVAPDAFMFSQSPVGSEPIRPNVLTKFTERAAKAAGVSTHLHALRHFSATQAIAAGFDPVTVGGRLGHADPSITLRVYSHALEQRDRELATALGGMLSLPEATKP
jgi:integrase